MGELGRDDRDSRIRDLEQRLEEGERRLDETQALTRVGSWEWDLVALRANWSRELLRIYDRGPGDSPPSIEELIAVVHPDDQKGVEGLIARARERPGTFEHSYRIIDAAGEIHHLRALGRTAVDADGNPVRSYGTTQDVSELMRSEQRLEETQSLARVGSWEWEIREGAPWRPVWSKELLRLFGRDPAGAPPTREQLIAYVHADDRPAFERLVERIQSTPGPFDHSYRIVREDGQVRHLQARGYVQGDQSGRPVWTHGTTQDITELKESQAQLERARRLEAVGQLAGGVAHDFNNLLSVILNHAEYALEGGEGEMRTSLGEIERAALSAADLTQQLLLFSRHGSNEMRPVDLAAVVAETEEMLGRTIGDHIDLTVDAPPGLPAVTLGEGQAQQILVNLVVNARDALPEGGTIAVTVRKSAGLPPQQASGAGLPPGTPHLVLSVADDGVGMSPEVAAQAFDPFFTTKPRGKGTGLGLATVYGIAGKAGGQVEIDSEPGHGTAVNVYLPVSTRAEKVRAAPRPAPRVDGQGRTILVVDNEEAVRTIVGHMLRKRGYRIREAAGGDDAEAIVAEGEAAVDLLLTDMLMPGMTGKELAKRVRAKRPGLPAIYMSGYAGHDASPLGLWDEDVPILQKPFTADQLLRAIGDALAGG
jgi:signal transduction histidine kinase/CheY-like chemotaxis protein